MNKLMLTALMSAFCINCNAENVCDSADKILNTDPLVLIKKLGGAVKIDARPLRPLPNADTQANVINVAVAANQSVTYLELSGGKRLTLSATFSAAAAQRLDAKGFGMESSKPDFRTKFVKTYECEMAAVVEVLSGEKVDSVILNAKVD